MIATYLMVSLNVRLYCIQFCDVSLYYYSLMIFSLSAFPIILVVFLWDFWHILFAAYKFFHLFFDFLFYLLEDTFKFNI